MTRPAWLAAAIIMNEENALMDEDQLNMALRKFLKHVGVTSQREIERVAHAAAANGRTSITLKMQLTAEGTDLDHQIEQEIKLV